MAPKPSFPASLLRTYTSLLSQRTAQLQFQASRLLGVEFRSQSQDIWRQHIEGVTRGIERITSSPTRPQPIPIPIRTHSLFGQRRFHSTDFQPKPTKAYSFEDVLSLIKSPTPSTLLIDVREPHEFAQNSIPTAINIPVTSQPDALLLDEEDFLERFGFAKPPREKEVVFFCKAGVRSRSAAGLAGQAGYENVGEYKGSWLDWERRGGPGTKTPPGAGGQAAGY